MEKNENLNNNIPSDEETLDIVESGETTQVEAFNSQEKNESPWILTHMLKPLGQYFKNIGYDIKRDVSENPNIIWFLLIALPGIFIGLFLTQHINAAKALTSDYSWSGFQIFVMELAGCLNIVFGFSVMKKRNLKSSIYSSICTAVIVVCGVLWISNFLRCEGVFSIENDYTNDAILSIICVAISVICPLIGVIASFFTRNKNYKKDTL